MILLALIVGALSGTTIAVGMYQQKMLRERSGLVVLLASIALFYPVFAAAAGDWANFAVHLVIAAAFVVLAIKGWRSGLYLVVGGLIAHGIFDIGLVVIGHPGPAWWPFFCGAFDVTVGVIVLRLLQNGKIPI